jgi:hypothetical protein
VVGPDPGFAILLTVYLHVPATKPSCDGLPRLRRAAPIPGESKPAAGGSPPHRRPRIDRYRTNRTGLLIVLSSTDRRMT